MDMKIIENKRIFAFDCKNECVAEVEDGEILIFRTHDCFDNQLSKEGSTIGSLNWDCINPATGPVYVKNALPGVPQFIEPFSGATPITPIIVFVSNTMFSLK